MNESTKRKCFAGSQIGKWICLLVTVGILCISQKLVVSASTLPDTRLNHGTNSSTESSTDNSDSIRDELDNRTDFNISINNGNGSVNGALRILIILTLIALAPTLLIMLTSFTRIIIVLHFTRAALSTQTAPPNQVLIGLALFLTFFIMSPTITTIYEEAVVPFEAGEISQEEMFDAAIQPIREFMYTQTQTSDVRMFMDIAQTEWDGRRPCRYSAGGAGSQLYCRRTAPGLSDRIPDLYTVYCH